MEYTHTMLLEDIEKSARDLQYQGLMNSKNGLAGKYHSGGKVYLYPEGVVLGRFQPLTLGHEDYIEGALSVCAKVLIVIGSAFEATSIKNPFTYEFRKALIAERFGKEIKEGRIVIVGMQDYTYRPTKWYKEFHALVHRNTSGPAWHPVLYTYGKDAATQDYIDGFDKRMKKVYHTAKRPNVDATDVRMLLFRNQPAMNIPHINTHVAFELHAYKHDPDYQRFVNELRAIDAYKASWAGSPFPPQFVAVDALVTWKDRWKRPHILVIKRKSDFGNGKLALPGGYLDQNETVLQGAKRELKEETTLTVDDSFVLRKVVLFDDPARSMRGRMMTHCHEWEVFGPKPTVKGMDDAGEAFWLPIDEIYSRKRDFFSDHYYILSFFYPEIEDYQNDGF